MQLEAEYIVVSNDVTKRNTSAAKQVIELISGGAIIVQATPVLDSVHYIIRKTTFLHDMNAEIDDARLMSERIKEARQAQDDKAAASKEADNDSHGA